jgi:DNA-binding MarR family transcriptional regulator
VKQQRIARTVNFVALADFRHELRSFLNFSEQAARTAGLEPQQHQALLALKGLPEGQRNTVGALAERMQIRHHSAVELANRLEANGWLRRAPSPLDGREVLLQLTPRGEHCLGRLSREHRAELQTTGPRLIRSLQAIIHHVERPDVKRRGKTRRK